MRLSHLLASTAGVLLLSAGAALAVEGCECCKDMAANANMTCCDDMRPAPGPTTPDPQPPASDAPTPTAPEPADEG